MKRARDDNTDGAPEAKKPLAMTPSTGVGIASLPTSALSHIWSYAVSMNMSDDVCDNAEHRLFQRNVHDFQLVCRSWRDMAQELLREKLRGVAFVDVMEAAKAYGESTSLLVVNIESFDKTSPVTDVRVVMGDIFSGTQFNGRGFWMDDDQPLIAVRMQRDDALIKAQPDIDWEASLKTCGDKITRLDLSRMLLYTDHLGNLLRAAAKLCPNVKALILPPPEDKTHKNDDVRAANLEALSAAMKAWHQSNGGLTHLRVPYVGMNDLLQSVMFINDVTQYCPDMEHLDGWRFSFIEQTNLEFITCDDYWCSPPELVSRFWATCTKLKSFNSVVLPFNEDFYADLADVDKPQLEELVLSSNSLMATMGEGMDSDLYQSITERVPALRTLTIVCGETDPEEWVPSDAFDDAFFLALAKNCPKLEQVIIKSFSDLENATVASLSALFDMPTLQRLSIKSIKDLDESFLDVLKERMRKKLPIRADLTVKCIRDMIWEVLELIGDMKTDEFNGVPLSLSLKTHEAFGYAIAKGDDQNGRLHKVEDIQFLVEEIKRVHGSTVRVHLHTTLPSDEEEESVQFDTLDLSINDPQGFCCTRPKFIECGMSDIEQELCGDDARKVGVFERDPEGVLEEKEYLTYQREKRVRTIYYPGLNEDDDDQDEDGELGNDFDEDFDDDDEIVFADELDEDEDDDEEEEEEEDDDDDGGDGDGDVNDIFGNGDDDDEGGDEDD